MSEQTFEELERQRTKFLYACDTCGKYYVLSVKESEQKQDCPQNSSHGAMSPTKSILDRTTCQNDQCKSFLKTNAGIGKCDVCKKRLVSLSELNVAKLPAFQPMEESDQLPGAFRTLQGKIQQYEGFTTSHHNKATSKGAKKTGTSQARERDSQADGADRAHKDKMAKFLNGALKAAIDWKQTQERQGNLRKEDEKAYNELKGKATELINRFGGTPVTED